MKEEIDKVVEDIFAMILKKCSSYGRDCPYKTCPECMAHMIAEDGYRKKGAQDDETQVGR